MPSPSPTLEYVPSTPISLRLDRLAQGAALIALGGMLLMAWIFTCTLANFSFTTSENGLAVVRFLQALGILVAIPLLVAALPPRPRTANSRRKLYTCLVPAALYVLFYASYNIYLLCTLGASGIFTPPFLSSGIFLTLFILVHISLLSCAAAFLYTIGNCLGRPALAIVLAGAQILPLLATLAFSLFLALDSLHLAPDSWMSHVLVIRAMNFAPKLASIWTALLWFAIALYAAILAPRQPR